MKFEEAKKTLNPDYRTWIYKKNDDTGDVDSVVVGIEDALQMLNSGWVLTPAGFVDDESLKESETFNQVVDEVCQDRNTLLNLNEIEDQNQLRHMLNRMFGVQMPHNAKPETIKKRILEEAEKHNIEGVQLTNDNSLASDQPGLFENRSEKAGDTVNDSGD